MNANDYKRGVLTMQKRIPVQFGLNEQKAIEDLEKAFPEWKYKNNSDKFKEMFWKGVQVSLEQENKDSGEKIWNPDELINSSLLTFFT